MTVAQSDVPPEATRFPLCTNMIPENVYRPEAACYYFPETTLPHRHFLFIEAKRHSMFRRLAKPVEESLRRVLERVKEMP